MHHVAFRHGQGSTRYLSGVVRGSTGLDVSFVSATARPAVPPNPRNFQRFQRFHRVKAPEVNVLTIRDLHRCVLYGVNRAMHVPCPATPLENTTEGGGQLETSDSYPAVPPASCQLKCSSYRALPLASAESKQAQATKDQEQPKVVLGAGGRPEICKNCHGCTMDETLPHCQILGLGLIRLRTGKQI